MKKPAVSKPTVAIVGSVGGPPYTGGIETIIAMMLRSGLRDHFNLILFDTFRAAKSSRTMFAKIFFALTLQIKSMLFFLYHRPVIVHIHFCSHIDFWKQSICLLSARISGRKVIFHLHGGEFEQSFHSAGPIRQAVIRQIFKWPHTIVALSQYWAQFLSTLADPEKITIVHNPVDYWYFAPARQRAQKLSQKRPIRILLLGRLGRHKGHYLAIKALPRVVRRCPDVMLIFAGPEEHAGEQEKLQEAARRQGVEDRIIFAGIVAGEDKIHTLQSSSIMILPSYGENLPLCLLEGMASHIPVIATAVGAIPELLDHGKLGLLINVGSSAELADALLGLIQTDPSILRNRVNAAARKIKNHFDVSIFIRNFYEMYNALL